MHYLQRFADLRWAGFLPQMFMRSTNLSATTKLSAEHETPPIANVLLWAGYLTSSEFANFSSWDSFTIFPLRARYSFEVNCSTFFISPFLSNSILP